MEIGIYTLGNLGPDPQTGKTIISQQRLQEVLATVKLADEAGLDILVLSQMLGWRDLHVTLFFTNYLDTPTNSIESKNLNNVQKIHS